jgi:hypothetical protein
MTLRKVWRKLAVRRSRLGVSDFANLARDAGEVIAARTHQALTGTLTAAEAHRMVAEKQTASVDAYFAFAKSFWSGNPQAAPFSSFEVFRKAVSGNRRRLKRRRK